VIVKVNVLVIALAQRLMIHNVEGRR
jgi:hypothetical protein